jgi:hypothetical protein
MPSALTALIVCVSSQVLIVRKKSHPARGKASGRRRDRRALGRTPGALAVESGAPGQRREAGRTHTMMTTTRVVHAISLRELC